MLHKLSIVLLAFLSILNLSAQENEGKSTGKIVNWGFKAGLNALSYTHYNVLVNDVQLMDKDFTNTVGLTGALFMRVNLNNFFMQPEFAYSYSPQKFSFQMTPETANTPSNIDLKANYYDLSVTVFAGYNIIKDDTYTFNVYMGPDFRYNYKIRFDQKYNDFNDKTVHYNLNAAIGFSLNISHILFDFRYEICRPNSDIHFNKIPDSPEYLKSTIIQKNANALNFSCGLIF